MEPFFDDLKDATRKAVRELRKNVVNFEKERFHREQRQEAQLVAEVYHNLRLNRYSAKDLFMEYLYPPTEINGQKKKLKPDLIFEQNGIDQVVEFRVFWDRDLYVKNSVLTKTSMNIVNTYYEKMLAYAKLQNKVSNGYLVFAFIGPEVFETGKKFNSSEFVKSVNEQIHLLKRNNRKIEFPTEVIVS